MRCGEAEGRFGVNLGLVGVNDLVGVGLAVGVLVGVDLVGVLVGVDLVDLVGVDLVDLVGVDLVGTGGRGCAGVRMAKNPRDGTIIPSSPSSENSISLELSERWDWLSWLKWFEFC